MYHINIIHEKYKIKNELKKSVNFLSTLQNFARFITLYFS